MIIKKTYIIGKNSKGYYTFNEDSMPSIRDVFSIRNVRIYLTQKQYEHLNTPNSSKYLNPLQGENNE